MLVHCNLAPALSHIRIKPARGLLAAREFNTFYIKNSTFNIRNPLILEAGF